MESMDTFDTSQFADELAVAAANREVGTKVLFENDSVKVWEIVLHPGERAAFHAHTIDYFWTCVAPGESVQRFPDGRMNHRTYAEGDTVFTSAEDGPTIHDLENSGDTVLQFVTVELKP